jgi:ArsR family transcriptional regulator, arsenate/arsenite/antimonite-responsive transcriptional repressor
MVVNIRIYVILISVNVNIDAMARSSSLSLIDDASAGCCGPLSQSELTDAEAKHAAAIFGALSDPVRLRMLSLIATETEVCSCALEEPLQKSQPTISHHTRILADAGLIEGEKRGRWMWWHVVPGKLDSVARILSTTQLT